MRKVVVFATLFVLLVSPAVFGVVEAGNKFCPVSGDKVSGKHFVEYQGKKYGLCCKMCAGKFNKNPTKFIAQMAAQEAQGRVQAAPDEHHDHEHVEEHSHEK